MYEASSNHSTNTTIEHSQVINDRNWNLLLEAIHQQRVVPIVGDEFFYVIDDGHEVAVKDYLLKKLSEKFGVHEPDADLMSISDAIDLRNFMNSRSRFVGSHTDLYFEINSVLTQAEVRCRESIIGLLSLNHFPLILTTSYIPALEEALREKQEALHVKFYNKTAATDISTHLSVNEPTLYYLFGRCSRTKNTFMATEDDLLDYLHLWHNVETRPQNIGNYLSNKFLLVLGCSYPNWLFRFFWHSIRNFTLQPNNNEMQGVVASAKADCDTELTRFLSRLQTQIYGSGEQFATELTARLQTTADVVSTGTNAVPESPASDDVDIFISYAHEDIYTTRTIVNKLLKMGASVWFDEKKLEPSDQYEAIIKDRITRAKRFVPILSQTTITPGRRFFRREWAMAVREMDYRFGERYFAPIIIDDTDPYDPAIPEAFGKAHAINMKADDFDEQLKRLIRSFR